MGSKWRKSRKTSRSCTIFTHYKSNSNLSCPLLPYPAVSVRIVWGCCLFFSFLSFNWAMECCRSIRRSVGNRRGNWVNPPKGLSTSCAGARRACLLARLLTFSFFRGRSQVYCLAWLAFQLLWDSLLIVPTSKIKQAVSKSCDCFDVKFSMKKLWWTLRLA